MNEHNKGLWLYSFSIIFVIFGIFLFANNLQAATITDPMTITVDISADNAVVGKGEDIRFSANIAQATGNDIVNATIIFEVGETEFSAELTGSTNPYTHTLTVADSMTNGELSFVKISIYLSDSTDTTVKEQKNYTESHTDVTATLSPATISIDTIKDITDPSSITLDISTTRSDTDVRVGESINFAANIVDTTEGIATGVDLYYKIAGGSQQVLSLSKNATHWFNSLAVTSSTSSGDFTFVSLNITLQNADNDNSTSRLFNEGSLLTLNSPAIITINPTPIASVTDPASIDVSITSSETDLRNGDTIVFNVDITDDMNGKAMAVTLTYSIATAESSITLTKQANGTWTNTLMVAGSTDDGTLSFTSITIVLANGDGSATITNTYVESNAIVMVTDADIEILSVDKVTDPTSIDVSITSSETALRNGDTIVFNVDITDATNGKATAVTVTYSIGSAESSITLTKQANGTWTNTLMVAGSTDDGTLSFTSITIGLANGDGLDTITNTYVESNAIVMVTDEDIEILSVDKVTDPTSIDVSITSSETALRNGDTIVFNVDITDATNGKATAVTVTYSIGSAESSITLTKQANGTWTNTLMVAGSTDDGTLSFTSITIGLANGDGLDTITNTYVESNAIVMVTDEDIEILSVDKVTDPTSIDVSITSSETALRNGDTIVFNVDITDATNGKATAVTVTYSIGSAESSITLTKQANGTWTNTLMVAGSTDDGTLSFTSITIVLANGDGSATITNTYVESNAIVMVTDADIEILSVDKVTDPMSVDVSITSSETALRNGDTIVFNVDITDATNGKATAVTVTYSIGSADSSITLAKQANGTWTNTLMVAGSTADGTLSFTSITIGLANGDGLDTITDTYVESNAIVMVTDEDIEILSVDRVTDPTSIDVSITSSETALRNGDTIVFNVDITDATNGKATAVTVTYSIGSAESSITLTKQANGTWTNTLMVAGSTADGTLSFTSITIGLANGDGDATITETYVEGGGIVTMVTDADIEILSVDRVTDPTSIDVSITSSETNLRNGDTIVFTVTITDATNGKATAPVVTLGYSIGNYGTTIMPNRVGSTDTWTGTLTIIDDTNDGTLSFTSITIELQNADGTDTANPQYDMNDDIVTLTVDSITILSVDRVTDPTSVGVSITADSTTLENDDIITFSATIVDTINGNTMSVIVTYNIGGTELTITLTDPDDDGTWSNTLTVDANTPNDKLTFVDIIIELQNGDGDDTNTRTYVKSDDIVSVTVGEITIRQIEPITALNEFNLSIRGETPVYLNEDISFIAEVNESEQGKVVSIVVNYQIGTSNLSIELTKLMNGTWSATHVVSNDTFEGKLSFVNMSLTVQNAAGSDSSTTVYDLDSNGTNSFYFFVDTLLVNPKQRVTDPQSLVFNITSSNSNENIAQEGDEITIKLVITDSTNGIVTKAIITYMIGDDPTQFEELLTEVTEVTEVGGENTFVFVFTVTEDTPLGELVLVSVLVRANNSDGSLSERKTYVLSEESEIATIHGSITVNAVGVPVPPSITAMTTDNTNSTESSTDESTSIPSDLDNVIPVSLTPMLVFLAALGTVISVYALKRRRR